MAKRKIIEDYEDENESNMAQGENYVLAIGIKEYVHFKKLPNAVKDVKDFIKLITQQYQFDNQRITPLFDEDATRRNIIKSLRVLAQTLKENDNLIIYFSGHGELDKVGGHGYWVPVDAEKGHYGDFINNAEILIWLDAMRVRHLFLISDSCFSGTLFDDTKRGDHLDTEPSRWALTSGRVEVVSDGKAGENSPFATELLSILRRNQSVLDMRKLSNDVMKAVANNAHQTPMANPLRGDKGGLFHFHLRKNEAEEWANALKINSIAIYQKFINDYPLSTHTDEARERHDYLNAKNSTEISVLDDFLEAYPKSIFHDEIFDTLERLEIQQAWDILQHKTSPLLSDYRNFKRDFGNKKYFSIYKDLCEKQIQKIKQGKIIEPQIIIPKTPKIEIPPTIQRLPFEPEMVFVEGGTFTMGEGSKTQKVSLSDFYIGKYPVTFDEYDAYCEATQTAKPRDENWGRGKRPVINVSWHDAVKYGEWLSKETKKTYRLPTEAQWEFAARGGTLSKGFAYSGSNDLHEVGWFWENSGDKKLSGKWDIDVVLKNNCKTHPVGELKPNELDIFDMSGNVWEWCSDWYGDYSSELQHNPIGAVEGTNRVLRVGSWFDFARRCRPTIRNDSTPTFSSYDLGFRLVWFSFPGR